MQTKKQGLVDSNFLKIDLNDKLGKGGYGIVYKGKYLGNEAAIKELLVQDLSLIARQEFESEARIMSQLKHPRILHLYGVTGEEPYRMVLEFCNLGALDKYLQGRKVEEMSWDVRFHFSTQIASGLHYLHNHIPMIVHADLKSQNVLLTGNPLKPDVKIADFGLSKLKTESQSKSKTLGKGSLRWMAPELFSLKGKKTAASDMYAFAITMLEIATHLLPYSDVDDSQVSEAVKAGERADIPENTPTLFAQVMTACWAQKLEDRPSALKALEQLENYESLLAEAKGKKEVIENPSVASTGWTQSTTSLGVSEGGLSTSNASSSVDSSKASVVSGSSKPQSPVSSTKASVGSSPSSVNSRVSSQGLLLASSITPQISVTQISWDNLNIQSEPIGGGGYGVVYKGTWKGNEVAIKQLHLKTLPEHLTKELENETQIMAQCQHQHIVSLYGVCSEAGHYAIVMEYMSQGSLYNVLQNKKIELPWEQRYQIAIDIGKGINFLHAKNILHRDLKSLNVLLDSQYRAKITDFGLSKVKVASRIMTGQKGTARWSSPESFKRGFKETFSTDIYSYGMVLWEIASRKLPFEEEDADEIKIMGWIKDGEKEKIPENTPSAYAEIVQKTWESAEGRPSANDIVAELENSKPQSEASEKNIAVRHFLGEDETKQNQLARQTYTVKTLRYLLPMLTNTAQCILYVHDERDIALQLKDTIKSLCLLSKALGRPALLLVTGNNSLRVLLIFAQRCIVVNVTSNDELTLIQKATLQELQQEKIIERCWTSKPLLSQSIELVDKSPVLVEWIAKLLDQPLKGLLTALNIIESTATDVSCSLEVFHPKAFKSLQMINTSSLNFLRKCHESILEKVPAETVDAKNVDTQDTYVQQCYEALPQRLLPKISDKSSNSSQTFLVQSRQLRDLLWYSKGKETLFIKEFKQLRDLLLKQNLSFIPAEEITRSKKLTEGNYGEVYVGRWKNAAVAIKLLKEGANLESQEEFKSEIALSLTLTHQRIVTCYGLCLEPVQAVFELMRGSLESELRDNETKQSKSPLPDWSMRKQMLLEMAEALSFLHTQQIVHCDLRASNFLVDDGKHVKLADFGLSKQRAGVMTAHFGNVRTMGKTAWLAPELIDNPNYVHTTASDVYSFGMVIWELATGKEPFHMYQSRVGKMDGEKIIKDIEQCIKNKEILRHHTFPAETPEVVIKLFQQCVATNPNERLTAHEIVEIMLLWISPELYEESQRQQIQVSRSSWLQSMLDLVRPIQTVTTDNNNEEDEGKPDSPRDPDPTPEEDDTINNNETIEAVAEYNKMSVSNVTVNAELLPVRDESTVSQKQQSPTQQLPTISPQLASTTSSNDVSKSLDTHSDSGISPQASVTKIPLSSVLDKKKNVPQKVEISLKESELTTLTNNDPNALFEAVHFGQIDKVKYLVGQEKVNIHAENKDGDTALSAAVEAGYIEIVKFLHGKGSNINHPRKKDNLTPLLCAAFNNRTSVVEWLCKQGVNIEARDSQGFTALMLAARYGYLNTVKCLVEQAKADIHVENKDGNTALSAAVEAGHIEVVSYLHSKGCDIHCLGKKDNAIPLILAVQGGKTAVVEWLCKQKVNVETQSKFGSTALILAAQNGSLDMVKYLVEQAKANVHAENKDHDTALTCAEKRGHVQIVEFLRQIISILSKNQSKLLERNSNPAVFLQANVTKTAAEKDNVQQKKSIVSQMKQTLPQQLPPVTSPQQISTTLSGNQSKSLGTNFNPGVFSQTIATKTPPSSVTVEKNKESIPQETETSLEIVTLPINSDPNALFEAARAGQLDKVKCLVEQGRVNVNAENEVGDTALSISAREGYVGIVSYLHSQGGNIQFPRKGDNQTPLTLAAQNGKTAVVEWLCNHNVNIEAQTKLGSTALILAASEGHFDTVKYLVETAKANVHAENKKGNTALSLAREGGHAKIAKYIDDILFILLMYSEIKGVPSSNPSTSSGTSNPGVFPQPIPTKMSLLSEEEKGGRLIIAARFGDFDEVKNLVEQSQVNSYEENYYGDMALNAAAGGGYIEIVSYLYSKGNSIEYSRKSAGGATSLMLATENGKMVMVEWLCKHGANVETRDDQGCTALILAARDGYLSIVKYLVEQAKANVHARDKLGNTALGLAMEWNHVEIVEYLSKVKDISSSNPSTSLKTNSTQNVSTQAGITKTPPTFTAAARERYEERAKKRGEEKAEQDELFLAAKDDAQQKEGIVSQMQQTLVRQLPATPPRQRDATLSHNQPKSLHINSNPAVYTSPIVAKSPAASPPVAEKSKDNVQQKKGIVSQMQQTLGQQLTMTPPRQRSTSTSNPSTSLGTNSNLGVSPRPIATKTPISSATEKNKERVEREAGSPLKKSNVATQDNVSIAALVTAAQKGDVSKVKQLYDKGIDVEAQDDMGFTALMGAANNGHFDIVKYLVEQAKANVHAEDTNGDTALSWAIWGGHVEIVSYLNKNGCDIKRLGKENNVTALILAAQSGKTTVVEWLCKQMVNVEERDNNGFTALIWAARYGHFDIVKYLVEQAKANVHAQNNDNDTALSWATRDGHFKIVGYIRNIREISSHNQSKSAVVPNQTSSSPMVERNKDRVQQKVARTGASSAALFEAVRSGELNKVKYLIIAQADIQVEDVDGNTPLSLATEQGSVELVSYLHSKGGDIQHPRQKNNETPLMLAVQNGKIEMVKWLCEQGVDIEAHDKWGFTALMYATHKGYLDIVKYLVEQAKADIYAKNNDGDTAVSWAKKMSYIEIVEYFKVSDNKSFSNQSKPSLKQSSGSTTGPSVMSIAARLGSPLPSTPVGNRLFPSQTPTSAKVMPPSSAKLEEQPRAKEIPGEAEYKEGLRFYNKCQHELARQVFSDAAKKNYPGAYLWLGIMYERGMGLAKDMIKAEGWFQRVRTNIDWFQEEAEKGNQYAQNDLGYCYFVGMGVEKDVKVAVKYYRLSADQGNAGAQNNLGACYRDGKGVVEDLVQAVKYYRLAADQGSADAQYSLAIRYQNGEGVAKDLIQAVKYFRLSADQGGADAQYCLGLCYYDWEGVTKDLVQAVVYFHLAADQGHGFAQYYLGTCYRNGEGVVKDMVEAVKYLRLVADQGHAPAQIDLADCYEKGLGVPKELALAAKYYQLAANQGNENAENRLKELLKQHPKNLTSQNPLTPITQFFARLSPSNTSTSVTTNTTNAENNRSNGPPVGF